MDLVKQAPQQRDLMTGAMPPVIRECDGKVAKGCATKDAEPLRTVDQAVLLQPSIQDMAGQPQEERLDGGQGKDAPPPT